MTAEKLYKEKYAHIPEDEENRYQYLIKKVRNIPKLEEEVKRRIIEIEKITWKKTEFTIYLVPKATPRPRATSKGSFFYVKGASDNKKYFRKMIAKSDWELITTPCIFECKSFFPIPSGISNIDKVLAEKGYLHDISMPDFDNLAKTYSDMIKGILLFDDRLIFRGISEKAYSVKPRIEVSLFYMSGFDSLYNEKKIRKAMESINRKDLV